MTPAEMIVAMEDEKCRLKEIERRGANKALEYLLKHAHGGGNWRRICEQLIDSPELYE